MCVFYPLLPQVCFTQMKIHGKPVEVKDPYKIVIPTSGTMQVLLRRFTN